MAAGTRQENVPAPTRTTATGDPPKMKEPLKVYAIEAHGVRYSEDGWQAFLEDDGDEITLVGLDHGQMYAVYFLFAYDNKLIGEFDARCGVPAGKSWTIRNQEDVFAQNFPILNNWHKANMWWHIRAIPYTRADGSFDRSRIQPYTRQHDKRKLLESNVQSFVNDNVTPAARTLINMWKFGDTTFVASSEKIELEVDNYELEDAWNALTPDITLGEQIMTAIIVIGIVIVAIIIIMVMAKGGA